MPPVPPASPAAPRLLLRRLPPLALVVGFLLLTRLALNLPAVLGANLWPLAQGAGAVNEVPGDPRTVPGVWARWDSGHYLAIAVNGYGRGGDEVAFFPGYPLLLWALAFGQPALMLWSGHLLANTAFIAAGAVLWLPVRADFGAPVAWATVVSLAVFPTSLFFSALYAESQFLLFGVLAYWCAGRRQYALAALGVAGAALTRITGAIFLLIPLVALWQQQGRAAWRQAAFWRTAFGMGLIVGAALGVYGGYLWVTQGSPVAFTGAHAQFWGRTIGWPWISISDSALVALFGNGGNATNWFMRAVSLFDVALTLLMVALTVLGLRWLPPGLAAYQAAALLFMLVSHGPSSYGLWSMSRVVLGLFPGFIVLGQLATRWPRARGLAWAAWGVSMAAQLGLAGWYGHGGWLA